MTQQWNDVTGGRSWNPVSARRAAQRRAGAASPARRLRQLMAIEPTTRQELARFVEVVLGLNVPGKPLVPGHDAPLDYLVHSFLGDAVESGGGEGFVRAHPHPLPRGEGIVQPSPELASEHGGDCIVWACRGGGKTMLGAAATLLDMLFKPGVQVRILGGSLEQSAKMYRYLRDMLESPALRGLTASEPTSRRVELVNGSGVELLSQSQRSVRGHHVHKLRCDEVEEFRADVWRAAQMITRSGACGGRPVRGALEAVSTMHRPFGLMSRLVERHALTGRPRVLRWCAIDVIERCPADRPCEGCVLWEDCRGAAKGASGFVKIDDLVTQHRRSSLEAWASELMCRRPRSDESVFPNFRPSAHVGDPLRPARGDAAWVGGMDFGLRNPLVMLWAVVHAGPSVEESLVEIVDEYSAKNEVLEEHLRVIAGRGHPAVRWLGVDPAGRQRNAHSGVSDIDVLRRWGYTVRAGASPIRDGIERIRRRLDAGTLRIAPRCIGLIESLTKYHYHPHRQQDENPVKDGADHACDALRYLVVNLECGPREVKRVGY